MASLFVFINHKSFSNHCTNLLHLDVHGVVLLLQPEMVKYKVEDSFVLRNDMKLCESLK